MTSSPPELVSPSSSISSGSLNGENAVGVFESGDNPTYIHTPTKKFQSSPSLPGSPLRTIKVFNDIVHPHMELPDICYKIINTPQFQRLRNLKQLGLCYHVYPSASHNRFEHCIGTSHLAGRYCKILRENQSELNIDERDVLCLYLGGLCHDLGHGPFSHTWERFTKQHKSDYRHESMSLKMLDYLIEDNNLWPDFESNKLKKIDLIFIKEIILGHPLPDNPDFVGRDPCKHFLYQIVSNDITKIDVDKFDYIMRDCKQLNVTTSFDYERVLYNSRVFGVDPSALKGGGERIVEPKEIGKNTKTVIAYRKKIASNLQDLFTGRFSLHQKAYQHKVTKIIEEMVLDGLNAANPLFNVSNNSGGKICKLSEAHEDMSAFLKLTDSVFELIVHWGRGGELAQRIFEDILKRRLYTFIGYIDMRENEECHKLLEDLKLIKNSRLIKTRINYGMGEDNPLKNALFFEKKRTELSRLDFPKAQVIDKCYIAVDPSHPEFEIVEPTQSVTETLNNNEVKEATEKIMAVVKKYKNVTLHTE